MFEQIFLLIALFIVAAVGIFFLGGGVVMIAKARKSVSWPTTTGTILSADIEVEKDASGVSYSGADVRYQYVVGHQTYTGDTIYIGDFWLAAGKSNSRGTIQRYFPGRDVDVYFDPQDPQVAVLEPGLTMSPVLTSLLGLVFSLVCVPTFAVKLCFFVLDIFGLLNPT